MTGAQGAPEPEGTTDAENSFPAVALQRWTKALPSYGPVRKKMRVTGEGGLVVEVHAYPAKLEKPEKE